MIFNIVNFYKNLTLNDHRRQYIAGGQWQPAARNGRRLFTNSIRKSLKDPGINRRMLTHSGQHSIGLSLFSWYIDMLSKFYPIEYRKLTFKKDSLTFNLSHQGFN